MAQRPEGGARRVEEPIAAGRGGRLLLATVVALAITALGWMGYQLANPALLPITKITVRLERSGGGGHLDQQALRGVIAPEVEKGFLGVDVDGVRDLLKSLPWVKEATVRRVWPGSIEIGLVEYSPVASWGGRALVDGEGVLFAPPVGEWPAGLPELLGPDGSAPVLTARYREARAMLAPLGVAVLRMGLDERRALRLELDNGIEVLLGRSDQSQRLLRLARAYRVAVAERAEKIARIDLRYTNGFAVVWRAAAGPANA